MQLLSIVLPLSGVGLSTCNTLGIDSEFFCVARTKSNRANWANGFVRPIIDCNKDNIASFIKPVYPSLMLKILVDVHKIADEVNQGSRVRSLTDMLQGIF